MLVRVRTSTVRRGLVVESAWIFAAKDEVDTRAVVRVHTRLKIELLIVQATVYNHKHAVKVGQKSQATADCVCH